MTKPSKVSVDHVLSEAMSTGETTIKDRIELRKLRGAMADIRLAIRRQFDVALHDVQELFLDPDQVITLQNLIRDIANSADEMGCNTDRKLVMEAVELSLKGGKN